MNARTGAAQSIPREPVRDGDGAPVPRPSADPEAPPGPPRPSAVPAAWAGTAVPAAWARTAVPVARAGTAGTAGVLPEQAQGSTGLWRTGVRGDARASAHGDPGRSAASASAVAAAAPAAAADADAAAVNNLLCCWVREHDIRRPDGDGALVLALDAAGVTLRAPVRYWSPTGRHDFGPPSLAGAAAGAAAGVAAGAAPLDAVTLAALIARQAAHPGRANGREPHGTSRTTAPGAADLVTRVADSVRRTARFLAVRGAAPRPTPGGGPFLDAEQSLVLGHPLHPAPKSGRGFADDECHAYAPETRAAFPLHWFAVDASVLACDSAWTERGRTVGAEQLAARLAGTALTARLPAGTVPLPLHPWQARVLAHRPAVARLFADGLLHDMGEAGGRAGSRGAGGTDEEPCIWYPTSSVRTVCRPGGPAMLKLSLGLPVTDSRRENQRKELLRGLEVHRLLRSGLGAQWRAVHPGFDIVRDPAWLGVDGPDGQPVPGLDTVIRHNPFRPSEDAVCLAGLAAEQPRPGAPRGALRSRLAELVEGLAARTGHSVATVATEWFLRYLDTVVRPVLWLDAHAGIALEAHQQNTLVLLDEAGWPAGGRCRDNQGYYFRESRRDALRQRLPGARLGESSDSFVDDAVADERFAYCLGIDNLLGLIGALGVQRLADERVLLAAARRFLRAEAGGRTGDGGPVSPLPALLLESPTLRCEANLHTLLEGLDELVGPVDTQSVYVTVTNPLCR